MKGSQQAPYTNEASSEFLSTLDKSPFTDRQLAEFSEEAVALIRQQQVHRKAHPAVAIFRLATDGSETRDGGVIQQGTTSLEITLENGQCVRVARVGDCAKYPDGSTAQIMTGAGQDNDHLALVGSLLSNGDQIINTPQAIGMFVLHDGISMKDDFLPAVEG